MMAIGWRFTVMESVEWMFPGDIHVSGWGAWSVTLLVILASTMAWNGGDVVAINETDEAKQTRIVSNRQE